MTPTHRERRLDAADMRRLSQAGYSLLELLVVASIIIILSAYTVFQFRGNRDAYRTDEQARNMLDFIREASQLALVQRQTMRLEINVTRNMVRLIDENGVGNADDRLVRWLPLGSMVRVVRTTMTANSPPTGVNAPPVPSNFPAAVFGVSAYPLSTGNTVCTLRFRADGTVVDANNNITSLTLYTWEPSAVDPNTARDRNRVRAITVFGATGGVRLWKYNGTAFLRG